MAALKHVGAGKKWQDEEQSSNIKCNYLASSCCCCPSLASSWPETATEQEQSRKQTLCSILQQLLLSHVLLVNFGEKSSRVTGRDVEEETGRKSWSCCLKFELEEKMFWFDSLLFSCLLLRHKLLRLYSVNIEECLNPLLETKAKCTHFIHDAKWALLRLPGVVLVDVSSLSLSLSLFALFKLPLRAVDECCIICYRSCCSCCSTSLSPFFSSVSLSLSLLLQSKCLD